MPNGYTRSPRLLKGALIQFSAPMLIPIPNIIVFQYNPETMTRTLTPWTPIENSQDSSGKSTDLNGQNKNALSQPYDPTETFSLTLELDATDALEEPDLHPIAVVAGVGDRLAAIEMLCYPDNSSASGGILNVAVGASVGGGMSGALGGGSPSSDIVTPTNVPIVLFFWGPGRIVPVRITSMSIEEQQYLPTLYIHRAKVTVGLKVLDEKQLVDPAGNPGTGAIVSLAKTCYTFTRAQKQALALANLANSVESIIGMLPV